MVSPSTEVDVAKVAAAAPTPVNPHLVDACTTFTAIPYDRLKDTAGTLKGVEDFNSKWSSICPAQAAAIRAAIAAAKKQAPPP